MSRAAYNRLVQQGWRLQLAERAKVLSSSGSARDRYEENPESYLFTLADPKQLLRFWTYTQAHGDMLMWQRRACVFRAWLAKRLWRRLNSVHWRATMRAELAAARRYRSDECFARGMGRVRRRWS